MENQKQKKQKRWLAVLSFMILVCSNTITVFAANFGESASKWILDQVFWVLLVVVVIVVAGLAAKRNFTMALTTAIVGAIVVFFVKNPTKLADIGNSIMQVISP